MANTPPPNSPWLCAPASLSLAASDQNDAIRQTVGLWSTCPELAGNLPSLTDAVLAREAVMTTALPVGVALPHARSGLITEPLLAIGRLVQPVDFAGTPVWLLVAIASPASQPAKHLELLNWLSRLLSSEEVLEGLRQAVSPEEIHSLPLFF